MARPIKELTGPLVPLAHLLLRSAAVAAVETVAVAMPEVLAVAGAPLPARTLPVALGQPGRASRAAIRSRHYRQAVAEAEQREKAPRTLALQRATEVSR